MKAKRAIRGGLIGLLLVGVGACSNLIGLSDYETVDEPTVGGASGSGGTAGSAGASGSAGTSGSAGRGGTAGSAGTAGTGGSAGDGGSCMPPNGTGPCDNVPQCGCPDGEACRFNFAQPDTMPTQCLPAGTARPYDGCTRAADCPAGYDCIGSACKPYCEAAASTCPGQRAMCRPITGDSGPLPNAFACSRTCNPVNPQLDDAKFDPCGSGVACIASETGASDCLGPTTNPSGTSGVTCETQRDCALGHFCSTGKTCFKWCRPGTAGDCPSGTLCAAFDTPLYGADVEFGRCITCQAPVTGGTCDTAPQCGCGANQNCEANPSTGVTACAATGTAQPFGACNRGSNPCPRGYTCYGGVCSPFCEGPTATCVGVNARCAQVTNMGTPTPGYFYCTRTCDPVNPQGDDATYDPCGAGINCFPSATRDSDCVGGTTATGTQGVNCTSTNGTANQLACAVGHVCRPQSASVFQCMRFCRFPGGTCPMGTTCTAFPTALYAGPNQIGFCSPPAG